jgi:hypothetical protein
VQATGYDAMKWTTAAWGFLGLAFLFAGGMIYLRQSQIVTEDGKGEGEVQATTRPVRAGKLVIAYAGDLMGSLDPCG